MGGNFADQDYWINLSSDRKGLTLARALFGIWINVFAAIVAACGRQLYRTHVKNRLLANQSSVNLWQVTPPAVVSEVFGSHRVLWRAIKHRDVLFVMTACLCIGSALLSAAATAISNRVIRYNTPVRVSTLSGRLVTHEHSSISGALVNITTRINRLNAAAMPLDQMLDFVPNDEDQWVYVESQWNNTWRGSCQSNVIRGAVLQVFPTTADDFQTQVPGLATYLPNWATVNASKQGAAYDGFYDGAAANGTGSWTDLVAFYLFGDWSPEFEPHSYPASIQVAMVNFLAHHVARGNDTVMFQQTNFTSDIHTATCNFQNSSPGNNNQAYPSTHNYDNAVGNIANVFQRSITDTSIAKQPVTQPTGNEMLRAWQAFVSVKDSQYDLVVQRPVSNINQVFQMRLSVLVASLVIPLAFLIAAFAWRPKEQIFLPSSANDWTTLMVKEHFRDGTELRRRNVSGYLWNWRNLTFEKDASIGPRSDEGKAY
ncbi:hypothetical protein DL96DRAFT_1822447 [Flagelloscypha sp. PMI_526]|nr:hypothetical protein DL96DRAFT_1822447 [Flagelloscypha sp. PMI_526]